MALRRGAGKTGGNQGLTPIDDIHGEDPVINLDPDSDTGKLPSQEEADERGTKRRRSPGKSRGRKTT